MKEAIQGSPDESLLPAQLAGRGYQQEFITIYDEETGSQEVENRKRALEGQGNIVFAHRDGERVTLSYKCTPESGIRERLTEYISEY